MRAGDDQPAGNTESGIEVNFASVTLDGVTSVNNGDYGLEVASLTAAATVDDSVFSGS